MNLNSEFKSIRLPHWGKVTSEESLTIQPEMWARWILSHHEAPANHVSNLAYNIPPPDSPYITQLLLLSLFLLQQTCMLPLDPGIGANGRVGDEVIDHLHPGLVAWQVVIVLWCQLPHLSCGQQMVNVRGKAESSMMEGRKTWTYDSMSTKCWEHQAITVLIVSLPWAAYSQEHRGSHGAHCGSLHWRWRSWVGHSSCTSQSLCGTCSARRWSVQPPGGAPWPARIPQLGRTCPCLQKGREREKLFIEELNIYSPLPFFLKFTKGKPIYQQFTAVHKY